MAPQVEAEMKTANESWEKFAGLCSRKPSRRRLGLATFLNRK